MAGIIDKRESKNDLKVINLQWSLKLTRRGVFLVIKWWGEAWSGEQSERNRKNALVFPHHFYHHLFYVLFCSSRGPFYIKSCESVKWSPKTLRCSHSIWTCSEGLLTKLTGRSHFPTLFSRLFLRKWVGIRKSVGTRLPSFRTGGYTSTLLTGKLLLTRPPFQIYQNIAYLSGSWVRGPRPEADFHLPGHHNREQYQR